MARIGPLPGAKLPPQVTGNEQDQGAVCNCLACGRIYTGDWFVDHIKCAYCGARLRSGKFLRGGKAQEAIAQEAELARAKARRDRLVHWDENVDMTARVLDDEEDYYETIDSVWATEEEREDAWNALEASSRGDDGVRTVAIRDLFPVESSSFART